VDATKILVEKWKVEWSALKKIECYTDVWLKDSNAKSVDSEQLKICESSTIDTKSMHIDFPAAPSKAICRCLGAEYGTWSYGKKRLWI